MLLVDTNVIGELARPRPNPGVLSWAATVSSFALSAVSVEEIFYGLARRPKARVLRWFEELETAMPSRRKAAHR